MLKVMHFSCVLMYVCDSSFTIQCTFIELINGKIHMCLSEENSPVPEEFPRKSGIQANWTMQY